MAFSYDLTTDIGRVRLLVPDRNADCYVFEDEELQAFLSVEGTVRAAAALALETMASNEAYVQKAIRILDLSTDGPATARALMARAAALRAQSEDVDGLFDVAEMIVNDFAARERLWKEALR